MSFKVSEDESKDDSSSSSESEDKQTPSQAEPTEE